MVSQALDTGLFITIAFWGVYSTEILLNMLRTQYIIKLAIAAGDTPFCYMLVGLLRKRVKQSLPIGAQAWV
jgi:hypothetical protein